MAYGDTVDPTSRVVSLVLVGVITFLLGWLLVSGLAISIVKDAVEKLDVMNVEEPPPPDEPPPPPPPDTKLPPPPPVVVPRTPLPTVSTNVVQNTVPTPPPVPYVPTPVITPPAPPTPPPAPPAVDRSRPARPRGNPQSWVTNDDYPPSAVREEAQGTTRISVSVGPDGRVTGCNVASSSGNAALDRAACSNVSRRARFEPALDRDGNPTTGSYSRGVRWELPEN